MDNTDSDGQWPPTPSCRACGASPAVFQEGDDNYCIEHAAL